MSKSTKAERKEFTSNLRTEVAGMRQEVATDLAGARVAWSGLSPKARKAKEEAERRAKQQAELRVRAEAELRAREEAERKAMAHAELSAKEEVEREKQEQPSALAKKKEKK